MAFAATATLCTQAHSLSYARKQGCALPCWMPVLPCLMPVRMCAVPCAVTGVPPLPQPARLQLSCKLGLHSAQQQQPPAAAQQPTAPKGPPPAAAHSDRAAAELPAPPQPPLSTEPLPLQAVPAEEVLAFASVDAALEGSTNIAGAEQGWPWAMCMHWGWRTHTHTPYQHVHHQRTPT